MNITIRKAITGDNIKIRPLQEKIAALHYNGRNDLFREDARYYTDEAFAEKLADLDQFIYIAENDTGDVIGYVFAYIIKYRNHSTYRDFDSFYIDDICVAEKYKRNGIGKMFLDECGKQAKASGCYNIDLSVWSFNRDAIAFYENCGLHERIRRMEMRIDNNGYNN